MTRGFGASRKDFYAGPQPRLYRAGNKFVFFDRSPGSWELPYYVCMFGLRKSSSKDAKCTEDMDAVIRIL
ncbi:hypothetical protein F2P81_012392 [Scophthalmus maximus]|uniref:Uncharacterized protein n=1 Tax=Scophthalmus maximus TaxID=52904 RepID=A0A6A4SUB5_SCOMX|nr:hypothetical protein F2P81_012392 [Scophthalmus maximus]